MTNHTDCLHPATKAGRAACRKAGGPELALRTRQYDMVRSGDALCSACFWYATEAAMGNLLDAIKDDTVKAPADFDADKAADNDWFLALAYTWARGYLFDKDALSACSDHAHLI